MTDLRYLGNVVLRHGAVVNDADVLAHLKNTVGLREKFFCRNYGLPSDFGTVVEIRVGRHYPPMLTSW